MSSLATWWSQQSDGAKIAIGVCASLAIVATGGAVVWAIVEGGMIVVVSGPVVVVAVGDAAKAVAARMG